MITLGIVGGAGDWHAKSFSEIINGYDKESLPEDWPNYKKKDFGGVRVSHIWDENKEDAQLLARICNIENVVDRKEDIIGKVDGIIVADDCTMKHQKRAIPFLKAGIPTFIDKPLSTDIKEAEEIIGVAKGHKAPMMSCSALRYAKEIEDFKEKKEEIGDILTGFAICKGELVFYGIHPMEALYTIVGHGIKSVRNIGSEGKDIVVITYKDGRKFTLTVYEAIGYLFQVNLYGTDGWRQITIEDADYFYSNMLKHFIEMVRTGKEPFPPEETLEIIKVLTLGKESKKSGEEIYL